MKKYTTLTELSEAFRSGELDESYYLQVDKGGCSLILNQHAPKDEPKYGEDGYDESKEDKRYEKCQETFQREYDCPMEELLKLAGIPSE